jgi:hypothetical protein
MEELYNNHIHYNNYYRDNINRITRVYLTCDESATDPVITTNSDNDAQLTYVSMNYSVPVYN